MCKPFAFQQIQTHHIKEDFLAFGFSPAAFTNLKIAINQSFCAKLRLASQKKSICC